MTLGFPHIGWQEAHESGQIGICHFGMIPLINHSYGPLPVISTYNPIYRIYNPIYNHVIIDKWP